QPRSGRRRACGGVKTSRAADEDRAQKTCQWLADLWAQASQQLSMCSWLVTNRAKRHAHHVVRCHCDLRVGAAAAARGVYDRKSARRSDAASTFAVVDVLSAPWINCGSSKRGSAADNSGGP